MSLAEFTATRLGQCCLPSLGDLAVPPHGRPADLAPGQLFDPLECPRRLTGVEIGADLVGHAVGEAQPRCGQRVRWRTHPFGQGQVVDSPSGVIGCTSAVGPGNQIQPESAPELDRLIVVRDIAPAGQCKGLVISARPRGLLGLPQDNPPLSQHG